MNLLNENFEIRDYLRILKRRIWYFIVIFIVIVGASAFNIVTRSPSYESYSIIKINPINPGRLSTSLKRVVPSVTDNNMYRNLAPQLLYSEYLTQLIDSLGMRNNEYIIAKAREIQMSQPGHTLDDIVDMLLIRRLKKMVNIRIRRINTIEISAETYSPEFSYRVVNTITNIFMEEFIRSEVAIIKNTIEFNMDQMQSFRKKLEQSERRLNQFRRKNIMDKEGHEILSVEASDRINEAIIAIDLTTRTKRDYLDYLNDQLKMKKSNVDYPKTPPIDNALQEIDSKIDHMAALLKRYAWNSPECIKVNRNINSLRETIKSEIKEFYIKKITNIKTTTLNLMIDRATVLVDLDIANRKRTVLRNILDSSKFSVSESQNTEMELSKLEQEVALNQSIYNLFLEQSKGIQIEEAILRSHASTRFQILEPPLKPIEPNNISVPILAFGTLIFAFIAGIGAVVLREFLEKSIRTVEEVEEAFDIPVIGVIPYLENEPFVLQCQKHTKR
jgi:uncharacterized protein involved in exopolysaccharide biosynthesis